MRNTPNASYQRRVTRHLPKIFVGLGCVVLVVVAVLFFRRVLTPAQFRQSIFIAAKPGYIVSFAPTRKTVTILDVPSDVVIKGLYGYGRYSVNALVSLDSIDKHGGRLITDSVSDAFGIPLSWMVTYAEPFAAGSDAIEDVRRVFTWSSVPDVFARRRETTVPPFTWAALVWAIQSLPSDAFTYVGSRDTVSEITSPDGSRQKLLDENKIDYVLNQSFFDSGLRSEGLTVALYNTTTIPTVGLRTSRLLTRLGMQLVFVGNSDGNRKACRIIGSKTAMQSKTAAFIRDYFLCEPGDLRSSDVGSGTGADLVVELGTDVASKYR